MAFYIFIGVFCGILLFFFLFCKVVLFFIFNVKPLRTTTRIETMWERKQFLQKLPQLKIFVAERNLNFDWIVFREHALTTVIMNKHLHSLTRKGREELLLALESENPNFFKMRLFWTFWILKFFIDYSFFRGKTTLSFLKKVLFVIFYPVFSILGYMLENLCDLSFVRKKNKNQFKTNYIILLR